MVVFMLWNATGTWRQIRHRQKQKCAPETAAIRRPFRQRHPIAAMISTLLEPRSSPAHHSRAKNRL
jgi:hypothetical protein